MGPLSIDLPTQRSALCAQRHGLKLAESPSLVGAPVATRMTLTASPMTSARRYSQLAPRGVNILIGRNKGVNLGENVLMEPPLSLG